MPGDYLTVGVRIRGLAMEQPIAATQSGVHLGESALMIELQSADWHALNVAVHVTAGALGLFLGIVPMVSEKGGPLHRLLGQTFLPCAMLALVTATVGVVFFDPPAPLVAVTLTAGYQFVGGLRSLRLRDRGPGLFDALLAVACLAACAWLVVSMGSGTRSWTPALGYGTAGFLSLVALYDLSRHAWPDAWLAHARPLDHGLKMTSAYFGMLSAGVGNLLRDYQPLSQVGPTVLGLIVAALLAASYLRRRSSRSVGNGS